VLAARLDTVLAARLDTVLAARLDTALAARLDTILYGGIGVYVEARRVWTAKGKCLTDRVNNYSA
jgi:hypothetical protein